MSEIFLPVVAIVALGLLIWDCVEVGRNDAANLVNGVFGARVMSRRLAVTLAGVAVVLGASFASPVMETARKGIFDPALLTIEAAVVVYITAYLVDTVLLHTYSAFGMPVSTTASLVFELVGASIAVAGALGIVHWDKVGTVVSAIVISILISGIFGFLAQRMFRGAIQDKSEDPARIQLHGPWICGLMFTWLSWFMIMKGLKAIPAVKAFKQATIETYGTAAILICLWGLFTLLIHIVLVLTGDRGAKRLFSVTAVIGMLCLSFAFGQNDLANCASPGLSALWLWQHADTATSVATKVAIPQWALFCCGLLMVVGMSTRNAQRVTRAAVNTGSQYDHVALYAPKWCRKLATLIVREKTGDNAAAADGLAPAPSRDEHGKRVHFDPLRASVIMAVSASVIALASGQGLPVSTTYVTFAAILATGIADRAVTRGDSDRKVGRAIWVIFCWFAGAALAMSASAVVAYTIIKLGLVGVAVALVGNVALRFMVNRKSARHENQYHIDANRMIEDKENASHAPSGPSGA